MVNQRIITNGNIQKILWQATENRDLLEKRYEVFDCPDTIFVKSVTALITDKFGKQFSSIVYKGYMFYTEYTYGKYDMDETFVTGEGTGIKRKYKIKQLKFTFYKTEARGRYKIKFKSINDVSDDQTFPKLEVNEDSGDTITVYRKLKPKDFVQCCDIVDPPDQDGDGFSILVDCNDKNNKIYPSAPICHDNNIKDANCNKIDDIDEVDFDGDTYTVDDGDCNDNDPDVFPDAPINPYNFYFDDNCDGIADDTSALAFQRVNLWDYVLVGKGHLKRGHSNSKVRNVVAASYFFSWSYKLYNLS